MELIDLDADVVLARTLLETKLAVTNAPRLRAFHVALARALERGHIHFPATEIGGLPYGYAARQFLTRIANEIGGVVGCLYWGTPLGALHHGRALMELAACAFHLHPSHDSSRLARRWERLREFEDAARAAQYERDAMQEGVAPYSGPVGNFSAEEVKGFSAKRDEWKGLYGSKKKKLKSLAELTHWHQPHTLKDLFHALPGHHWDLYGYVCNSTHFSPLGYRLGMAPGGGSPLFVVHADPVNRAVGLAAQYTELAVLAIDEVTPLPALKELLGLLPLPE